MPSFRLLAMLCAVLASDLQSQEQEARGLRPLVVQDEKGGTVTLSASRALLIGNSAYTAGWPVLSGVVVDLAAMKQALERHGFSVQVETNLSKNRIAEVLDTFIEEQAQTQDARVVVGFAGHGYSMNGIGYLVGVDAPLPTERGFLRNSYEISLMKTKALQMRSRQVLFLFDSCFSGSVFTPMRGVSDYVLSSCRQPVRMFLTAGGADEQVPDRSFFREEFIRGVDGAADANHDGYVTGSELAVYIRQEVHDRARAAGITLTPQAGLSEQEGYNKGDFVFRVPGATDAPVVVDERMQARADAYVKRMEASFSVVQRLDADPDIPLRMKQEAWHRLQAEYAVDEAATLRDDQMREQAAAALVRLAIEADPSAPIARPAVSPPRWAATAGRDRFGTWAEFTVSAQTVRMRLIPAAALSQRATTEAAMPAFWISDTMVTQALWRAVQNTNPSYYADDPQSPVDQVSWDDCGNFLSSLNGTVRGLNATIPTQPQWSYVVRSGGDSSLAAGAADGDGVRRTANSWGVFGDPPGKQSWLIDPRTGADPLRAPRAPRGGWGSQGNTSPVKLGIPNGGVASREIGLRLCTMAERP